MSLLEDTNYTYDIYYRDTILNYYDFSYINLPSYVFFNFFRDLVEYHRGMSNSNYIKKRQILQTNQNPYIYNIESNILMYDVLLRTTISIENSVLGETDLSQDDINSILTSYEADNISLTQDLSGELFDLSILDDAIQTSSITGITFDLSGVLATSYIEYLNSYNRVIDTLNSHINSTDNDTKIYISYLLLSITIEKLVQFDYPTTLMKEERKYLLYLLCRTKKILLDYVSYF